MDGLENDAKLAMGFADVEAAAKRIAGKAVKTPLLTFPLLEKALGFRLLVKAETERLLQQRKAQQRRLHRLAGDPFGRGLDIGETHRQLGVVL